MVSAACPACKIVLVESDADPATGVAVYNTYQATGWAVYGGTSASSPFIAGVYALAGTPGSGDYPYSTPGALNDVTSGNNGTCTPDYLCTAGTGYDGPTGLGTPNGLLAFTQPGPHGVVSGTARPGSAHQAPPRSTSTTRRATPGPVVCTGGVDAASSTGSSATYIYDPGADSWSAGPDLPIDLWAMAYTAANGQLLVSGGATANSTVITNQGYAFDPSSAAWTALPNSNNALYRGAGTCGFDKVGGSTGNFAATNLAEQLPGYTDCGGASDVPWLSESPTTLTLAPGQSAKVRVTVDGSDPSINQPGAYTATLLLTSDTPYPPASVPVTFHALPPSTWGKVTGVVTGKPCTGSATPLPGATVEIDSWATSYTLKTDQDGHYGLWLDKRNNPLSMIVAKDGWRPQATTVSIKAGKVETTNFTLLPAKSCS